MKHKLDVTINELRLKSIRKIVKRINTWSDEVKSYSDDALKQKTIEFKERLASGVDTLDTLLPEAYAVAREASWRVLGMYPKEVQLIGAIVLHEGNIAEMQTGEGKTLTATMPLYLNALSGKGTYLITTNDYLAKRWSDSNLAENNQLYSLDAQRLSQSNLFNRKVKQIVVKAQRISEEQGVKAREMANEFEKSISIQRDLVYEERNRVLEIDDAENRDFKALAKDVFEMFVNEEKVLTKSRVVEYIYQNLSFQFNKDVACVNFKDKQAVVTFLLEQFEKQLALNRKNMQSAYYYNIFVQKVFLKAIDSCWLEQVDYLQQLKASVNQRQNGQRNAIFEYHRVALDSFEVMTRNIKKRMVKNICQSMITFDKEGMPVIHFP